MSHLQPIPPFTSNRTTIRSVSISGPVIDDSVLLAWNTLPDAEPMVTEVSPVVATPSPCAVPPAVADEVPQRSSAPATDSRAQSSQPPRVPPAVMGRPSSPFAQTPSRWRQDSNDVLAILRLGAKWMRASLALLAVGLVVWHLAQTGGPALVTHPVQIKVLLRDQPLPGAHLTLTPVVASLDTNASDTAIEVIGRGQIASNGISSPSATGHAGLPAGEYIASLTWCKVEVKEGETVAGPDLVPQLFRNPSTSPLRVKVAPENNSLVTLALHDPKLRTRRASYDHE